MNDTLEAAVTSLAHQLAMLKPPIPDLNRRALELVIWERIKQVQKWTYKHDDRHDKSELALAAASVALEATADPNVYVASKTVQLPRWIINLALKHKEDPIRATVVATALMLAELERLLREEEKPGAKEPVEPQSD